MNRAKVFFLWLYKFGLTGFLIFFLCVAPFSVLPNVLKVQGDVNKGNVFEYQGILELWHVETFEGGSVSRATFLERESRTFENKHKGTYISIQTMTLEQFDLNLSAGKKPNMLSFGIGVGSNFLNDLVVLDSENVRQDIAFGGKFNGKQMAIPYILGGYGIITNNGQNITDFANENMVSGQTNSDKNANGKTGVGLLGTINPLKAMQKSNIKIAQIYDDSVDKNMDSYTAYDRFIKGNFSALVGTQRDVFRCENRVQNGKMQAINFNFLGGWTDIVQYVSIFKSNQIEEEMCKKFVSGLVSNEAQKKLSNYNLFSVLKNIKLYNVGTFADFENVLNNSLEVENVFLNKEQIDFQKQEAYYCVVI